MQFWLSSVSAVACPGPWLCLLVWIYKLSLPEFMSIRDRKKKTKNEEGRNVERKDGKKKGRMERRKKTALYKQLQTL